MDKKWMPAASDEAKEIIEIIRGLGWSDIPASALIRVYNDDKGLAGFHVLQMRPHAEPIYVRPDLRGGPVALQLATDMNMLLHETGTPGFIVIADTPEAVKLCEMFGMKKAEGVLYVK